MLCDNLDMVESFGDVGDLVREGICRTVCRMRRLNNDTLRLFLDSAARRLVLFDCAGTCHAAPGTKKGGGLEMAPIG